MQPNYSDWPVKGDHVQVGQQQVKWHRRVLSEERVPCGICVTHEFFDERGALLRRDQTVLVDQGLASSGVAKLLQKPKE